MACSPTLNRVAVFGVGGVGGYLGALLARMGAEVHFIARGPHLHAIKTRGLRVRSSDGDFELAPSVTDDPHDIGPCSYVIVCVKSFDTETVAAMVKPLLGAQTAVVSLQNGVDNEEKFAARIGWPHVMGGVSYLFASIVEPGFIEHTGGPPRVVIGEWSGARSNRARTLRTLFANAGVNTKISGNIQAELWRKFAIMCAVGGMTAATRLPVGSIRGVPTTWRMLRRVGTEVAAVAQARGVRLPAGIVDQQMRLIRRLDARSLSSLHYDLIHAKPMELEALHGAVVRMGRNARIATPACEAIYSLLAPWASGYSHREVT